MASRNPDRRTDRDGPSAAGRNPAPEATQISVELPPTDHGELDWTTWIELVALLRQSKFVPRLESVDGNRLTLRL